MGGAVFCKSMCIVRCELKIVKYTPFPCNGKKTQLAITDTFRTFQIFAFMRIFNPRRTILIDLPNTFLNSNYLDFAIVCYWHKHKLDPFQVYIKIRDGRFSRFTYFLLKYILVDGKDLKKFYIIVVCIFLWPVNISTKMNKYLYDVTIIFVTSN